MLASCGADVSRYCCCCCQGADRMTVERVTRFYLGEFQTTLTTGGKYINQLDPEEEKALNRCSIGHLCTLRYARSMSQCCHFVVDTTGP